MKTRRYPDRFTAVFPACHAGPMRSWMVKLRAARYGYPAVDDSFGFREHRFNLDQFSKFFGKVGSNHAVEHKLLLGAIQVATAQLLGGSFC